MEHLLAAVAQYGYMGLFAALMLGIAGLPLPDETILVFCGYLVSSGRMQAVPAFLTAAAGSICGITLSYFLGRTLGHKVVERFGRFVHLTPARLARVHVWFERAGNWLLTFGYFLIGVRHFTALVAGISELEFPVFARFAWSGAVLWVATFLSIGYLVGENWRSALVFIHRYSWYVAGLVFVGSLIAWLAWLRRRRPRI